MKYGLIALLFLSGCASMGTSSQKITMPEISATSKKNNANIMKEAAKTKVRIGEKGNQVFDFYYGPKGAYFIVVTSLSGSVMNLSDYDVTLSINNDSGQSPEVISMAIEDQQVLSGFGEIRDGLTQFELTLNPVDSSISRPLKFEFKVSIINNL